MKCLECKLPAALNGEIVSGIEVRECEAGHRTAQATPAMVKQSISWKRSKSKKPTESVFDLTPTQPAVELSDAVNQ